jgi:hypothetical protein
MIGITEPRRVAATAMSARVAYELGKSLKYPECTVHFDLRVFLLQVYPQTRYPIRSGSKAIPQTGPRSNS